MDFFKAFDNQNKVCECGKVHKLPTAKVYVGSGAINNVVAAVNETGAKKAFVLSDKNTFHIAAEQVLSLLKDGGIECVSYSFSTGEIEPDERAVGSAIMHFNYSCGVVIAVGSGVINDIGKIVSATAKVPYIIVGTAPSMDGFASASSSMTRDGVKISLPSKSAEVIIGDTDILKNAPMNMLKAGLGDMVAKYVSICEWRISNIITGEYYCEKTAKIVRDCLKKCVDNADGLLKREEKAVEAVFEGLVLCGAAMAYVGASRPASGVEHYFSHVWDMRGVEFSYPLDLHGNQCAVGTFIACNLYEKIKKIKPNKEKALAYVKQFNYQEYKHKLREFLGKGAESLIELEKREKKYDLSAHTQRLEIILQNWSEILNIINKEIPPIDKMEKLFNDISLPKTPAQVGVDDKILKFTFETTKDIRDKYVLSRLAWDLGVIDELF